MKTLIVSLAIVLAGCSTTVPVARKFPEAPEVLKQKCESLKLIEGDKVAITEMLKVIVHNYSLYHECSTKVEGWNEWYEAQKKIFNEVK
jgi:hypothetical protein